MAALLSQLRDYVLGIRKCRRFIRQVRAFGIIRDPVLSVYRENISRRRLTGSVMAIAQGELAVAG